jgi:hypothetical protein
MHVGIPKGNRTPVNDVLLSYPTLFLPGKPLTTATFNRALKAGLLRPGALAPGLLNLILVIHQRISYARDIPALGTKRRGAGTLQEKGGYMWGSG